MPSKSAGRDQQWLMFAIPGAVVVVLLGSFLVIFALRPKPKPAEEAAAVTHHDVASKPAPTAITPPPQPTAPPPSPSTPPANTNSLLSSTPSTPSTPTAPPAASDTSATPTPAPPPAAPAPSAPKNLLTLVNLPGDAVAGIWTLENGQLKSSDGNAKNHARIRLIPPPSDTEYDFSVTFTTGPKPYVSQILTFKGKQFIWTYFQRDSGFAQVGGKSAHANASTVPKGIKAATKYTSVIKVRNNSVAAYLNGELYSTLATDYSDMSLNAMWDLGAAKPLGIVAQCPITIDAITLTPIKPGEDSTAEVPPVAATPAAPTPASAYKQLARIITNSYSTQSSAGATQPAGATATIPADLQAVAATSQPVIADLAAGISQPHPAADADALFKAITIATGRDPGTAAARMSDPLLEHPDSDQPPLLVGNPRLFAGLFPTAPSNIDRASFDLEQSRLAAWKSLIDQLSQIYPKAESTPAIVKLEVSPNGSFFAISAAPAALTNVTLIVEVVNIATSPSVTARQYYFIPSWAVGHKIFLPAMVGPNVSSSELLAMTAPGSWNMTDAVEVHAQLWSDKISQPLETTKLDANVEPIARDQLNDAFCSLGDFLRRPPGARMPASAGAHPNPLFAGPVILPKITLADTTPAIVQAKAAAQRVLAILPTSSPLAADATALATDPQSALHDLRKKQLDEFLAAIPAQKFRNGVWAIHRPGLLDRLAVTGRAAANRITLTIDTRGPTGEVTATLANPETPVIKRKLAGRIQVDGSSNRLLLQLHAAPSFNRAATEADIKTINAWTRLLLEVKDTQLRGIAEVGAGDGLITLNVAFDQPLDVPKPPAK